MLLFSIYFDLLLGKDLQLAPAEGCSLQLFVQAAALPILTHTMSTDSTPDNNCDRQPWWGGSKHPPPVHVLLGATCLATPYRTE